MKTCPKCKIEKDIEEFGKNRLGWKVCLICNKKLQFDNFYRDKKRKDGHWNACKICVNNRHAVYHKKYRKTEKYKQYKREYSKKYNITNRAKELRKIYNKTEQYKQYRWNYRHSEKFKNNIKERKNNDIIFKLTIILRKRLNNALKYNVKNGSAIKDLGCSVYFLKKYLESKFVNGMSWNNYGQNGWHIDHIKPLSRFNLSDIDEFLKAANYKNLQPLWAIDNLKKGINMIKVCPKCKIEKPLNNFGKNIQGFDGHQVYCKVCMNKTGAKYRDNTYQVLCERYGITLGKYELKQIEDCRKWNKKYFTNYKTVI